MGVLKRQGLKESFVSYLGVIIGFVSTIKIYSLDRDIYGVAQYIIGTATLFLPVFSLGAHHLTIRFFPTFKNKEKGHYGFLGLLFLWASLSFILSWGLIYLFHHDIIEALKSWRKDETAVNRILEDSLFIFGVSYFLMLNTILIQYSSGFRRIVVPNILTQLSLKLFLPILLLSFVFLQYDLLLFKQFLLSFFALTSFAMLVYIWKLGELNLRVQYDFLSNSILSSMFQFALWGIVGSMGTLMVTQLDKFMIPLFLNTERNGTYSILINITNIVVIPLGTFFKLFAPVISEAMYKHDFSKVKEIYKKSSIMLGAVGVMVFGAIWLATDYLFLFMKDPDVYFKVKNVILFIGLARIFDMLTGMNAHIIVYSKYYYFNVIAIFILGGVNIGLNYFLIPVYGIIGAAMATGLSLFIFNVIKFIFVWAVLKMQPFDWAVLFILLNAFLSFILVSFLPDTPFLFINLALKPGLFIALFSFILLFFNLSPDITSLYEESLRSLKKKLKKR